MNILRFIGDKYLVGTKDIIDNLNKTIEDAVNEMSIAYLSADVDIAEFNEPASSEKSQSKIVEPTDSGTHSPER